MKPVKPSFDFLRARLERQYLDPDFDPSTGLDAAGLDARIEAYWDAHSGEPLIRTRAALLELVLTAGRIGVDPDDRFADHIETGSGIRALQEKLQRMPNGARHGSAAASIAGST